MTEPESVPEGGTANDIEQDVRERVKELKDFYGHLGVYVLVNVFLIIINLLTSPGFFWAIFPMLGWGIGLGGHAVGLFGLFGIGGKAWEERKVRELMIQRQRGLSAEQVRQLLHDELEAELPSGQANTERLLRRLENLEAIVTSKEWDQLETSAKAAPPRLPESSLDDEAETQDPSDQAAKLARRVR